MVDLDFNIHATKEMELPDELTDILLSAVPSIVRSQNRMVSLLEDLTSAVSSLMNVSPTENDAPRTISTTTAKPPPSREWESLNAITQKPSIAEEQDDQSSSPTMAALKFIDQATDCSDIASRGAYDSGTYTIKANNVHYMDVYCDMDTDGGGWTVFQKRFDGSVDFFRDWEHYENGFGTLGGEFWLGLRQIYQLTLKGSWVLRIDLEDFDGNKVYAEYDSFALGDASSYYRLSIKGYSGTAGDSLMYHNNKCFSTVDSDHDTFVFGNCAQSDQGAWWYANCAYSNLNGLYKGRPQTTVTGMAWFNWKKRWEVLKRSEIKIRRS